MTDIVSSLREDYSEATKENYAHEVFEGYEAERRAAADEIERLREALEDYVNAPTASQTLLTLRDRAEKAEAENARLREALERLCAAMPTTDKALAFFHAREEVEAARAVLAGRLSEGEPT